MKKKTNRTVPGFYIDIHGHTAGTIPFTWKAASLFRMPRDRKLTDLAQGGIGGIICAIGDAGTFKKGSVNEFEMTQKQIGLIKKRLAAAGQKPVLSSSDLAKAATDRRPAFLIGIEGGDFIKTDLSLVEMVHKRGVRLICPMHYSANDIGSIGLGWRGREIPEDEHTGLTGFGREFVREANRLGIILDLAHADDRTLIESADASNAPLICSHTGAAGIQRFGRYISDESIRKIADGGGLIGLWPYSFKGLGMEGPAAFQKTALYMKNLAGTESIALGTDFNGVPGYMDGFSDVCESGRLVGYLEEAGFSGEEIEMIGGQNFLRVFKTVEITAKT